jgi:hypothetical protein
MKTKRSSERNTTYARGGADHMVRPQSAGPQNPGGTAHNVKGGAPGAKSARGGGHASVPGRVLTAKGGRTGVR